MMKRELPKWNIHGTTFNVDVKNEWLVQVDDAYNKIRFTHMDFKLTHYEFDFDPAYKNIHAPFDEATGVIRVKVPTMIELDPEGMAEKYRVHPDELKDQWRVTLQLHEQIIVARLKGKPPLVEINNKPYALDVVKGQLKAEYDHDVPIIRTSTFKLSADRQSLMCLYEPKSGSTFPIDENRNMLPDKVSLLKIPPLAHIDPIGMAKLNQLNELYFVWKFPPLATHIAEVKQVSEKNKLPELYQWTDRQSKGLPPQKRRNRL
jgi:hypothetical protein